MSDAPAPFRGRRNRWLVGIGAVAVLTTLGIFAVRATTSDTPTSTPSSSPAASSSAPAAAETVTLPPRSSAPLPVAPSARDRLRRVVDEKSVAGAASLLIELGTKDAAAFRDRAVQSEAAAAAELAATAPDSAQIFDLLSTKLGTDGLDVLFDVVAREAAQPADKMQQLGFAAPTAAGPRARAILSKPDVLARATPAMRVAYELRRASCQYRQNLFPRAGKEGDDRALQILTAMTPPGCSSQAQSCCVTNNHELDRAIADIQARLRR